ncbi:hypothetical protein NDU88_006992 [Pleurodeles waltl]|uniref:Uncharacterized protein n=1 Tax=Pleurodeles waltl TaxID=8319 RepID=A0AAV7N123_PLEWA|nr:hypothetical protein NDU88_006992 [Pleurodeles waltl]
MVQIEPLIRQGLTGMASQRHNKKEDSLKDLFNKTPVKKAAPPGVRVAEGGETAEPGPSEGDEAPLSRVFMEQLFGSLREDFTTLKQEITADVKDLKREVVDLGQRVDTLEQTHDTRKEELDCHRRELLTVQDKNQELQYQLEDPKNRLRCSNIRLTGVPAQAVIAPWRILWCAFFATWPQH